MLNITLTFITSFFIVLFGIPSIITIAKLKGLYDSHNDRKLHTSKIPRLGGLGIFAAFTISVCLWTNTDTPHLQYLTAGLIVLFFSGLKDDIIMISPFNKLVMQMFAAGLVCIAEGIRITSFQGLFGIFDIAPIFSISISIFTLIVITNAFNLIDGVDGLAGGLSLIISITFSVWFYLIGEYGWSTIGFALAGAILGFLFFNFSPAKIFMGDAGSLTIGFLIAVFTIKFIEFGKFHHGKDLTLSTAPVIAIAILIIPLYDTLRVFILRILNKQSPFKADRNHLHHWLIKIGLTHSQVSLILYATNVLFIAVAFILRNTDIMLLNGIIVGMAIILGQLPIYIYRHLITDIDADANKIEQEIEELLGPTSKK
jgi:UDP-N-acetylmuramyl pentapeptide phosphotransferase/UDP-N-acetylglucosamine-1-phosphate transferase